MLDLRVCPEFGQRVKQTGAVPSDPKKILALLTSAHFYILSIHQNSFSLHESKKREHTQ